MKSTRVARLAISTSMIAGISAATLLFATEARAQAAPHDASADKLASAPEAEDAASSPSDGEIVVTARRRGESLSKVPLSIVAIGSDELAARNLTSEADLQRSVPGLTIRSGQTDNALTFTIRGQGVDTFSGSRPAVVSYLNEVPLSSFSASSYYDLESIQVLKGPQGTLFGRNTTGGAVLYTTAKPTDIFEGYASAQYGNYDALKFQAALNAPLIGDKVLLRVAGSFEQRDGWQYNVATGQHQSEVDRQAVRATLAINPGGPFESTTVGAYSHSGGSSIGLQTWSVYGCGETNNGIPLAPASVACAYGPAAPYWDAYLAGNPNATPGGIVDQPAVQRALGTRKVNSPVRNFHRANDYLLMNTSSLEISPALTVKNIIAYAKADTYDMFDPFGTGPYRVASQTSTGDDVPGTFQGFRQSTKSLTEEIQISGSTGNLTYLVGGFFSWQRDFYRTPFTFFDLRPVAPPAPSVQDFVTKDNSQAVYAQSTLDLSDMITPGLKVTGGFRYTWEQIKLIRGPLSTAVGAASENISFSDPSWTIGLDYQASPDLLLYALQRGSFRAGGINGTGQYRPTTSDQGGNLFLPERARDIEVGAKFAGTAGTMPIRANLAVYTSKITNIQRALFTFLPADVALEGVVTLATITVNIPSARVRGVEFDGSIEPFEGLQLGGSVTYTDAKYTNGRAESFGTVYNYGPYADTPKWSGSAFAVVTVPIDDAAGKLTVRGDVYSQSAQYFSNLGNTLAPNTRLPSYTLINASINWTEVFGTRIDLSAFIKNATQKGYFTGGFGFPPLGINSAIPGEPRTYGISAKVSF